MTHVQTLKIEIDIMSLVPEWYVKKGVTESMARAALKAGLENPDQHVEGEDYWNKGLYNAIAKTEFPQGVMGEVLAEHMAEEFIKRVIKGL